MLLTLTPDQELFRSTTARFLGERASVDQIRGLRDDPAGFPAEYWSEGAGLGWVSLLVDEKHGGGSISDQALVDLTLVAYEFGRHAAPGPLADTNVVASALSSSGSHDAVITEASRLLSGTSAAALCRRAAAASVLRRTQDHDRTRRRRCRRQRCQAAGGVRRTGRVPARHGELRSGHDSGPGPPRRPGRLGEAVAQPGRDATLRSRRLR